MKKGIVISIIFLSLIFAFSSYALASASTVLSGTWQFSLYEYTNGSTTTVLDQSFNLSQMQNGNFFTGNFVGTSKDDKVQFLYVNIANGGLLYWQGSNQQPPYFYVNFPFFSDTVISLVGRAISSDRMQGSWIGIFNGQEESGIWHAVRLTHEQVSQQTLWGLGGFALIVLVLVLIRFLF